jgi:D-sedoheptulose 7-phosphate isomerase
LTGTIAALRVVGAVVVSSIEKADDSILGLVNSYFNQVGVVLGKIPRDKLEQVIYRIEAARWMGQVVFICGNGGSAATAIHFASDLSKGALAANKPPIKSRALCENISLLTAWSNDVSYDDVFTKCMYGWIKPMDVLIAISGSGNSKNILNAVDVARDTGVTTIGFVGFDGGKLKNKLDICITVPCYSMEQVEDMHLILCHLITACLREIRPENKTVLYFMHGLYLDPSYSGSTRPS